MSCVAGVGAIRHVGSRKSCVSLPGLRLLRVLSCVSFNCVIILLVIVYYMMCITDV